ncbi:hypothetical protein PF005_g24050 [Phytophthora fragariae]|uniref:Uncharacterized protein n=2 Tax=Phytophthora fragariae TaxID=53985 RepID=A0A6A3W9Y3_9STRA|nr:hypothetical protein PF003_g13274 [Phytophthora fragariae]KAE9178512.1 hypothetical protein PF005_g24050 [Phytophthora fragariae]
MPRGMPAAFNVYIRLPLNSSSTPGLERAAATLKLAVAMRSVRTTSLWGRCSSLRYAGQIHRRTSWIHTNVFHPEMEAAAKRLKQQQLRVLLLTEPTVAPTEMDSMFLLEINQMYYLH